MAGYDKFLPEAIPAWQEPFWTSLRNHAVTVQRCDACGAFRYVPKEICPRCHSPEASWTPIAGTGTVYTYTVVRRPPTPAYRDEVPYVLLHVEMDEGFRMVGSLVLPDPDAPGAIRIGDRVRADYDDVTPEWTLLRFVRY